MNRGKEKCEQLKHIRRLIAEEYRLNYTPTECTHQGPCSGTCPACDAELQDLQRQLDARGLKEVELANVQLAWEELMDKEKKRISSVWEEETAHYDEERKEEIDRLEGAPYPLEELEKRRKKREKEYELEGDINPFFEFKDDRDEEEKRQSNHASRKTKTSMIWEKKRILYKECLIAGISYHHAPAVWNKLHEGDKLVLVRHKENPYDPYAIAVALADDTEEATDAFDYSKIIGYVPRSENEHLAKMIDLGWADAFECRLSSINGRDPYHGNLYMRIYMVSKESIKVDEPSDLWRVLAIDKKDYSQINTDLKQKGYTYFRYGGFPPWEHRLPKRGEKVVFMLRAERYTYLYLMHCVADNEKDASYFIENENMLFYPDDSCLYVFTNTKGPLIVMNKDVEFLPTEKINQDLPEEFLSRKATYRLRRLFEEDIQSIGLPCLEHKGYKGILTFYGEDGRLKGVIYPPEDPTTPLEDWMFFGDEVEDAEKFFKYQVDRILYIKAYQSRCLEWKNETDHESVRCVMNILPDEFEQRATTKKFDKALLEAVEGGDYVVPLYYVTKAWDIILKGTLSPIDFMIGPEEEEDCTEVDIHDFLIEESATRSRFQACLDNNRMKRLWKEWFDVDIDALEIDFFQFNKHLPPNVSYKDYQNYFTQVPDGIDNWILDGINKPDITSIYHDQVSALMELTAEVLMRRKGKLKQTPEG